MNYRLKKEYTEEEMVKFCVDKNARHLLFEQLYKCVEAKDCPKYLAYGEEHNCAEEAQERLLKPIEEGGFTCVPGQHAHDEDGNCRPIEPKKPLEECWCKKTKGATGYCGDCGDAFDIHQDPDLTGRI